MAAALRKRGRVTVLDVALVLGSLALAYGMKRGYSTASPEELRWVLAPTAAIAGALTSASFVFEPHVGYVDLGVGTAIVPACAGVNFLIIAFVATVLAFVPALASARAKGVLFVVSMPLAYVATLGVNGGRVAASVAIHRAHFAAGLASPAALHRGLGVVVYLVALFGLCEGVHAVSRRFTGEVAS